MTTATEITEAVQDGLLKAVEAGQRLTLEAVSAVASTVDGMVPARPAMPFATAFFTPQEAIDSGARFAARMLESHTAFLSELATFAMPAETAPPKKASAS